MSVQFFDFPHSCSISKDCPQLREREIAFEKFGKFVCLRNCKMLIYIYIYISYLFFQSQRTRQCWGTIPNEDYIERVFNCESGFKKKKEKYVFLQIYSAKSTLDNTGPNKTVIINNVVQASCILQAEYCCICCDSLTPVQTPKPRAMGHFYHSCFWHTQHKHSLA